MYLFLLKVMPTEAPELGASRLTIPVVKFVDEPADASAAVAVADGVPRDARCSSGDLRGSCKNCWSSPSSDNRSNAYMARLVSISY